jgi:carboxypeptidase family protein/TonB-dependent receptor-like protein
VLPIVTTIADTSLHCQLGQLSTMFLESRGTKSAGATKQLIGIPVALRSVDLDNTFLERTPLVRRGLLNAAKASGLLVVLTISGARSQAQTTLSQTRSSELSGLIITVTDENKVAVAGARVELRNPQLANALRCQTDFTGHCEFSNLMAGAYEIRVERPGFYPLSQSSIQVGATSNVDVVLSREQEARESVDVVASVSGIDPMQTASTQGLTDSEIIDIPYPGPHDYRNALSFVPGVTPGSFGQLHVAGAEGYQTQILLDGFNVSQPTNGQLSLRTSVDSFRSIQVTPSREAAEFGKGSGGMLALNTRMGGDRFQFRATDFFPGFQTTRGLAISSWTPIYSVSGPIVKGKVWFLDALDGEFDDNVAPQLPPGADRDYVWRADDLAKLQVNPTTRNIVTASFLANYFHDKYDGLGFLVPQSATPTDIETAYYGSVKDQHYFRDGAVLEAGFGVDQYDTTQRPQGDAPYIQLFFAAAGNYYLHENATARREQGISNLWLAPHQWHGRHDLKVGADVDRLSYDAQFLRQPISFEQRGLPPPGQPAQPCATDANGIPVAPYICTRYSVFSGGNLAPVYNDEASAYAEDRWLITNRFLLEPGLRLDWDELVRTPLFSPRLAATYILDDEANTKLSAGIGIVYDATNLGLIHQPLEGQRVDYFFKCIETSNCLTTEPTDVNGDGTPQPVPVPTAFLVNRNALQAPRYTNASGSLEKKFPHTVFLKLEYLDKRGVHAFAYNTLNGAVDGVYVLGNQRDDRYDAFIVSLRHHFRGRYEIFGAYTRSSSRSNQIFDFSLDIPLLTRQLSGPFGWDTPNRFVGWGILPGFNLPLIHKFDIVYSAEARNGLPFYGTTDQDEIARPANSLRLPTYYTLNLQVEKRFHLFGRYWALRGGFDDITNHADVIGANSTIDSSHPAPTFIDGVGRAFDARIRLLGGS